MVKFAVKFAVEYASDDFPSKRSSKISFQTSPEVCHQFRRKLRQLHSGNRWCLKILGKARKNAPKKQGKSENKKSKQIEESEDWGGQGYRWQNFDSDTLFSIFNISPVYSMFWSQCPYNRENVEDLAGCWGIGTTKKAQVVRCQADNYHRVAKGGRQNGIGKKVTKNEQKVYFVRSPENFCGFFFKFTWEFALKNGGDFWWIFSGLRFPLSKAQKLLKDFRENSEQNSGGKFEPSFCNLSDLKEVTKSDRKRDKGYRKVTEKNCEWPTPFAARWNYIREEKFLFQYQSPPQKKMFMGKKSPVRMICLFFPGKSYGPGGPKKI